MGSGFGPSLEFPHHYLAMIQVMNEAGLDSVQTDEAKPPKDLFGREQTGKLVFVPQSVLQRQEGRPWPNQRRQQFPKDMVRSRLQTDDHQIARANLSRSARAFGPDLEITLRASDGQPVSPNRVIIRAQEEMNLLACPRQFGAIKAADCPATNYRDFHKKRHPDFVRVPCEKATYYFAPRIASLAALATRNFTTRLAGMVMI